MIALRKHAEAIRLIEARLAMNAQNLQVYENQREPSNGYLDELKAHDASLRETLACLEADEAAPPPEELHAG